MAPGQRMWHVDGWEDPWFEGLDSAHKIAFMYLVLGHKTRPSGLFVQSLRQMALALGATVEQVTAVLADFDRDGKVHRDPDRGVVWVVNKARQTELAGMGPGVRQSIVKDLLAHRASPLVSRFITRYPEYRGDLDGGGTTPVPPPSDPGGSPDPHNQDHSHTPTPKASSTGKRRARVPDPLWDALVAALDLDPRGITSNRRGKLNAACKQLREVGATPAEVAKRAKRYRREHPDWAFTETALASHWASLAGGKSARPVPPTIPDEPEEGLVGPPPEALDAMRKLAARRVA